jgi:hypothetical protein
MWRRNRSYGVRTSASAILTMKKKPKKKWIDIFVVFISLMKIIICFFSRVFCVCFFSISVFFLRGRLTRHLKRRDQTKEDIKNPSHVWANDRGASRNETKWSVIQIWFGWFSNEKSAQLELVWALEKTCRECSWTVRLTCRQELKVRNWEFEMNRVISHLSFSLSLSL